MRKILKSNKHSLKKISHVLKVTKSVSPVIATVLLIALSVLAGLLVTITVLTILTIPQPVQLSIETPFDYKTSDSDVLVDSFRFGIRNDGDFAVEVLNPQANIKILRNNAELELWRATVNSSFVVNAKSSVILTMTTSDPGEQLTKSDKFQIILKEAVIPSGENPEDVPPSTVASRTFTVGDTYGPVKVNIVKNNVTHLQVNVTNLGTITLSLQVTVNSATINFTSNTVIGPLLLNSGESNILTWQHEVPTAGEKHIMLLRVIDFNRGTLLYQQVITLTA